MEVNEKANRIQPVEIELMDPAMVEAIKSRTGAERLSIAFGMWRMAREIVECSERRRHPELSGQALQALVSKRMSHGAV